MDSKEYRSKCKNKEINSKFSIYDLIYNKSNLSDLNSNREIFYSPDNNWISVFVYVILIFTNKIDYIFVIFHRNFKLFLHVKLFCEKYYFFARNLK